MSSWLGIKKPIICEKSFLPLSNWVTWGKSVSELQDPTSPKIKIILILIPALMEDVKYSMRYTGSDVKV